MQNLLSATDLIDAAVSARVDFSAPLQPATDRHQVGDEIEFVDNDNVKRHGDMWLRRSDSARFTVGAVSPDARVLA
jgi:hypothetical protein